ncbi:MAG: protein arginine kinase [Parachlamydia sp.]|jgi:protein arginine kinase|nr:protein arginine kinase [Parachlamydia sp.]
MENNNTYLCNAQPWKSNSNPIWLGSTLTLLRNMEKFNFPAKLTTDRQKQIQALITRNLMESNFFHHPKLVSAEEMQPIEQEYLVEHFLMQESLHQAQGGEAFVIDQSGESLVAINFRNHIMLQKLDIKDDLEGAWDWLFKVENLLSSSASFAFSPKFGFLTADPSQCGTGLVVHIFMHLPALIYTNRLEEVLKKTKEEGVEQAGLHGDPNDLIGDIAAFHNTYTLGLTEENIITMMRTLATKLIVEEKGVRLALRNEQEASLSELKDRISRAYGVLLHSYQIEAVEALKALSLLKLGLDLEWVTGATLPSLNELIFEARRAHLLCHYGKKVSLEDLPHKRADFIHRSLKGMALAI